jgi:hypothetical protein
MASRLRRLPSASSKSTTAAATAASTATATTTSAATAASTAAIPSAATTTSASAFTRRTRLIHDHVAAHEILAVQRLNRAVCIFIIRHFNETETARLPRKTIPHQSYIRRRNSRLRKPVSHILFSSLKRQIAHVQFFHERTP